jgi:hypothetical protein
MLSFRVKEDYEPLSNEMSEFPNGYQRVYQYMTFSDWHIPYFSSLCNIFLFESVKESGAAFLSWNQYFLVPCI